MTTQEILADEPIPFKFTSLKPFEKVNLKASTTDEHHVVWTSSNHYIADEKGVFDLKGDMTPLTAMEPPKEHLTLFYKRNLIPLSIDLKLYSEQDLIFTTEIKQLQTRPKY